VADQVFMRVKFWGVRGSIPTPIYPFELRAKVKAVLQEAIKVKLEPEDLDGFIDQLQPGVVGTAGGNTPCLEVTEEQTTIIVDAGTGLIGLGLELVKKQPECQLPLVEAPNSPARTCQPLDLTILLTHTHWDHIQGFPFFQPAYKLENTLKIYGDNAELIRQALTFQQSSQRLFPVCLERTGANISFHSFPKNGLTIGSIKVDAIDLPHPGGSLAFRFKSQGHTIVFATDYEFVENDIESERKRELLTHFLKDADVFISDTQYTYLESMSKEGWGHSNPLRVVEMAVKAGVKKFFLFHHNPHYSDNKLYEMLDMTEAYTKLLHPGLKMDIKLAIEGETVEVGPPSSSNEQE
jgi:phosphoribosyl 1,2-cyclic phosphodiesterase